MDEGWCEYFLDSEQIDRYWQAQTHMRERPSCTRGDPDLMQPLRWSCQAKDVADLASGPPVSMPTGQCPTPEKIQAVLVIWSGSTGDPHKVFLPVIDSYGKLGRRAADQV